MPVLLISLFLLHAVYLITAVLSCIATAIFIFTYQMTLLESDKDYVESQKIMSLDNDITSKSKE
jgi:hypothetical protein